MQWTKCYKKGAHSMKALNAYHSSAATQKTELVSVNKVINIKYRLAETNTRSVQQGCELEKELIIA
ncbi:MAG: hypothetical protein ACYDAJ_12170 [Nitrosotalea sp.]